MRIKIKWDGSCRPLRKKLTSFSKSCSVIIVIFLSIGLAQVYGAGYQLFETGAAGLGYAYAGKGVSAEDASIVFNNPAGMTQIEKDSLTVANHTIITKLEFKNEDSPHAVGGNLKGTNGEGGGLSTVPNVYLHAHSGDYHYGLAVNAPFGSSTQYNDDWVGRYHAVKSSIQLINITPSLGWRLNKHLSFGLGVNIQMLNVELSNMIDLSGVLGRNTQSQDGHVKISGKSLQYGLNLGVLYRFDKNTRIGVSYHSAITHKVDGTADFTLPQVAQPMFIAQNLFQDTDVKSKATIPAVLTLSAGHRFNPEVELLMDITHTFWSVFEELVIKYDNPNQSDSKTSEEWQNTTRFALGLGYQATKNIKLRTGIAYDQSAIGKEERRTPRVPDNTRNWLTFGGQYQLNESINFDLAYAYLQIPTMKSNNQFESSVKSVNHTLKGEYESNVQIVAAQLNWNF